MSSPQTETSGVRLAELVATISLGTDLGLGQPMEHIIRQTRLSLRLAERLGLDDEERTVVYYAGLLAWVGCHTDAYEQAKWFGDELLAKRDAYDYDFGKPTQVLTYSLRTVGAGRPVLDRVRLLAAMPLAARRGQFVDLHSHWVSADLLARRLGLGDRLRASLSESFERWDGKGPGSVAGERIQLTARLVSLADVVTVFNDNHGREQAVRVARERSGTQFDPALVELFCADASTLLDGVAGASSWDEVIAEEPTLGRRLTGGELDTALGAVADYADLKSPYTLGHSRSVSGLADAAADELGFAAGQRADVRRAGLVHDLGRLGVPNTIWDKTESLTLAERERIRLHPYLTERMLAFTPALARLGSIAVQHHERLDGSGYPRGLTGASITAEGRVLSAADAYATLTERRPHRAALSGTEAAASLRRQVHEGKLDPDATEAVLAAAGHRVPRRRTLPAGLTAREVEVLRLLALGMSNREIARELTITARTAGSHVEHIYTKIGAGNRASASLFATSHGLVGDWAPAPKIGRSPDEGRAPAP